MSLSLSGDGTVTGVTAIGDVSSTELGYLDGVTSALQTQINTAQATADSSGLVLIQTTQFSGASQVVFDSVFTSAYKNYKFLIDVTPATSGRLAWVLRASSSDVTGNYNGGSGYISTSTGSYTGENWGTNSTNLQLTNCSSSASNYIDLTVYAPALAQRTGFSFNEVYFNGTSIWGAGAHEVSAAQAGIRFFMGNSSNMTGEISVYGIAK